MSDDWWNSGQGFVSPDRTMGFVRIGIKLYRYDPRDGQYYEMAVRDNLNCAGGRVGGAFHFEDIRDGVCGTLVYTSRACMVQLGDDPDVTSYFTGAVSLDPADLVHIQEFDPRQEPALLFEVIGRPQLVYFSRLPHNPSGVDAMWVMDDLAESHTINGVEFAILGQDETSLLLTTAYGGLTIPRPGKSGNGQWANSRLRQIPHKYCHITHNPHTGELTYFRRP